MKILMVSIIFCERIPKIFRVRKRSDYDVHDTLFNFLISSGYFLFQLDFFEVSEFSFTSDLIKEKEGFVSKRAGSDYWYTKLGLIRCITKGLRFLCGTVLG